MFDSNIIYLRNLKENYTGIRNDSYKLYNITWKMLMI